MRGLESLQTKAEAHNLSEHSKNHRQAVKALLALSPECGSLPAEATEIAKGTRGSSHTAEESLGSE